MITQQRYAKKFAYFAIYTDELMLYMEVQVYVLDPNAVKITRTSASGLSPSYFGGIRHGNTDYKRCDYPRWRTGLLGHHDHGAGYRKGFQIRPARGRPRTSARQELCYRQVRAENRQGGALDTGAAGRHSHLRSAHMEFSSATLGHRIRPRSGEPGARHPRGQEWDSLSSRLGSPSSRN